jgi:hypothetical protein
MDKAPGERVKELITQLDAINDRETRGRHAFQVIAEDVRDLQGREIQLAEYADELEAASGDLALALLAHSPPVPAET